MAQSFDATRLALEGEAFRVSDNVSVNPGISLTSLSASASGPIASGTDSIRRTQFTWFARSGKRLETLGTPDQRSMANPSLSPDVTRIAFSRVVGGNWDIWVIDMQGAVSQVTSALSLDFNQSGHLTAGRSSTNRTLQTSTHARRPKARPSRPC